MTHHSQNVVIVGAGAIGSLLYQGLYRLTSSDVKFKLRQGQAAPSSMLFTDINNEACSIEVAILTPTDGIDLVFLCCKAYDIKAAFESIRPQLNEDAMVVLCHNGMGCAEQIMPLLPNHTYLYSMTTTHGALMPEKWHCKHTGLGRSHIGLISNGVKTQDTSQLLALAELLSNALPTCDINENVSHSLWLKLAINAAINPLTAIHQCKNGELENTEYQQSIKDVCQEICLVAGLEQVDFCPDALYLQVLEVIRNTAQNQSSMNRDIANKKQTEIDYINGYIVATAEKHQHNAPINRALVDKIKALERKPQ